jgi:hypothetical protein
MLLLPSIKVVQPVPKLAQTRRRALRGLFDDSLFPIFVGAVVLRIGVHVVFLSRGASDIIWEPLKINGNMS